MKNILKIASIAASILAFPSYALAGGCCSKPERQEIPSQTSSPNTVHQHSTAPKTPSSPYSSLGSSIQFSEGVPAEEILVPSIPVVQPIDPQQVPGLNLNDVPQAEIFVPDSPSEISVSPSAPSR